MPAETPHADFVCLRCGNCCRPSGYVRVSPAECDAIASYLGLPVSAFIRDYTCVTRDRRGLSLTERGDGACIFLDGDGHCAVYAVRPRQCRTYPFWPEIVNSAAAWRRERQRCEGIGRGKAVPVARIRSALRACAEEAGSEAPQAPVPAVRRRRTAGRR